MRVYIPWLMQALRTAGSAADGYPCRRKQCWLAHRKTVSSKQRSKLDGACRCIIASQVAQNLRLPAAGMHPRSSRPAVVWPPSCRCNDAASPTSVCMVSIDGQAGDLLLRTAHDRLPHEYDLRGSNMRTNCEGEGRGWVWVRSHRLGFASLTDTNTSRDASCAVVVGIMRAV